MILASDDGPTDSALGSVVVERDASVAEEAREPVPVCDDVRSGLADGLRRGSFTQWRRLAEAPLNARGRVRSRPVAGFGQSAQWARLRSVEAYFAAVRDPRSRWR